jgi:hypothetical protein
MRVIVLQVGGLDRLTELQIAKLQAQTKIGFVDAVNTLGLKTNAKEVSVSILEGPGQRTRTKPTKKAKAAVRKRKPDAV